MAPIKVYGMDMSAPCRIIYMTCEVLGLDYNEIKTDLMKGENKTPEYLKMNPQHTIPTMVDDDFIITESRAAAGYLISKYGKDDKLYPKDTKTRAIVDQRLYFDAGVFYSAFGETVYPLMLFGASKIEDAKFEKLHEVLGWARDFVKKTGYVAGTSHLTLADISFVATYSTFLACKHVDVSAYPELNEWFEKVTKEIPNYAKACGNGATNFGEWYKMATKK